MLGKEPHYPLTEGWMGSRAGLVDLERNFIPTRNATRLVGGLVGRSVNWWVGWLGGWLVGWSASWWVGRLVG